MKIIRMKRQKKELRTDMFVMLSLVQTVVVILIIAVLFAFTRVNAGALDAIRNDLGIIFGEDLDMGGYFTPSEEKTSEYGIEPAVYMSYGEEKAVVYEQKEDSIPTEESDEEEAYVAVPVVGNITSFYGSRVHPVYSGESFHSGLDIAADEGQEIFAVLDGVVTDSGTAEMAGNYLKVDHGNGITTLYCHCSELYAVTGQQVKKGETIAAVGQTGLATGPHLHLEVTEDGKNSDPLEVFPELRDVY